MNAPVDDDRTPPARRSLPVVLVVLSAIGGLAIVAWALRAGGHPPAHGSGRAPSASRRDDPDDSPFLNTKPGVRYVGDAACNTCHGAIAESFSKHPMGRSLARVAVAERGKGLPVVFPAHGLEYAVEARDGTIVHHERRRDGQGRVLAERSEAMNYVVGSGRGGESYVFERDGFLFQSPISWYARDRRWELSPGYENRNPHFERNVAADCLFCHANRFEPIHGTVNRYRTPIFDGLAIGCERCHGPGALHAASPQVVDGKDLTIVNPRHLDPVRRDSVCQQCHLKGEKRVLHAGRDERDFRPGLPLHRFWSVFVRPDRLLAKVQAVGHVEQMEASRCYQASGGKLGCTSCHDPHKRPAETERGAYFRDRCLECHADRGCSLPESTRRARSAEDLCTACHMPRVRPTDIAHAATTLHRIPRRPDDAPRLPDKLQGVSAERDMLVHYQRDLVDARGREGVARDRAVALAEVAWELEKNPVTAGIAADALAALDRALDAQPDDQVARESKGLALMQLGRLDDARAVFQAVIDRDPARENATAAAAELAAALDRHDEAVALFQRALKINPWASERWHALARVYAQRGDWRQCQDAESRALRLNPLHIEARKQRIEALAHTGKLADARAEVATLAGIDATLQPALDAWLHRVEQDLRSAP